MPRNRQDISRRREPKVAASDDAGFGAEHARRRGRPVDLRKRTGILAVAKRVFLERGFHAASMDLIAARAGVSKITVYAHYSDKATLFGAIIEDIAGQLTREIDQLAIAGLPPEQALRRVGATYLRLTLAPQSLALYRLLVAEAAHYPKLGRLIHQSGPRPIVATLARYLESRRELRIGDTLLAAEQFLGMVLGHRQLGLLLDALPKAATRADIDKVVDHAVNLFLYGCGA